MADHPTTALNRTGELWELREHARIALRALLHHGSEEAQEPTPEGIAAMEAIIQEMRREYESRRLATAS